MHWDFGWIIVYVIAAAIVLVFWGRELVLSILAIYRTLRYGDPTEPRKYQIGKRLVSMAIAIGMLSVVPIVSLPLLFLEAWAGPIPPWYWIIATILICLIAVSFCLGFAFMLPGEIADIRREAREAHESGEGFWVGRHSDG